MELNDFCKYYSIKFNCYDINCNEIISYIPDKINRSYATLKIIAYNNHIYPVSQEDITNIKLGLNNKLTNKYKLINNLENKIIYISVKLCTCCYNPFQKCNAAILADCEHAYYSSAIKLL